MSRMQGFDWYRSCTNAKLASRDAELASRSRRRSAALRRHSSQWVSERQLRVEPLEDRRMLSGTTQALLPPGSLIYSQEIEDSISVASETDSFALDLDSGQTVTFLVEPATELQPAIELFDPANTSLGSALAAAAGQHAVLQTITIPATGTYTFTVDGEAGTFGDYHAQIILNGAVEDEQYGGPANDSIANAQELDPSFISIGVDGPIGTGGAERGAVLGRTDPNEGIVFSETQVASDVQFPNVLSMDFHGVPTETGAATLSLRTFADLGDPGEFLTIEAEGIPLGDVFVNDGLDLINVTTTINLTQTQVSSLAADGSVSITVTPSSGVFEAGAITSLFVTLDIEGSGADFYRFSLAAGQSASMALTDLTQTGLSSSTPMLELLDDAGNLLTMGVGAENANHVIQVLQ